MPQAQDVHRWSTRQVPPGQRFDNFADALASSLLPMSVTAESPGSFEQELAATAIGPLSVALIGGSAHRAVRAARELARSGGHTFHLVVALTTTCRLQHRSAILLQPGDATLVDSRYGHDFALGPAHQNLNLTLQADWLRQWLPAPESLIGRTLPRESGWVRALVAFASGLTPDFLVRSPLSRSVLADHLGSLLALSAAELGGPSIASRPAERALSERICECIRQRAADSALTAAQVAQSVGVSLRTMHRALASSGQSFSNLLIATRADSALRMLESPLLDRLSIEEVGRRAGFVDPSHFARVLKSRVGLTPLQIRRRRTPDPQ